VTRGEKWLQWAVIAGAVSFFLEAVMYVPEVFNGPAATRPYAINSVAKDILFFALTAVAAADLRRWSRLIGFVILGHVVIITLLVLAIATGNKAFDFPPPRWLADLIPALDISEGLRAWVWLGLCTGATALLIWLYHRALKDRYQLRYLWPIEHDTLAAVAEAILEAPRVKPADIATKIDRYWAALDIGYKTRLRAALWLVLLLPLRWLRPPLTFVGRDSRRDLIENRMLRAIAGRSGLGPLRTAAQSSIRFAMQLVYIGYYDDPASYEDTHYTRFSKRPANGQDRTPRRPPKPLRVLDRPERGSKPLRAEVVVVGSGAGGSIAAHVLAEAGHDVLMVERGAHVDPDTFTEDEADQYARLYSDGALQVSRDFSFQVLQGMCVGGGTVVNNAICLDPPDEVLELWNGPRYEAGLPIADVKRSVAQVRALIGAQSQGTAPPNGIVRKVPHPPLQPLDANIKDCLGSGYCNIGCKWGRKLSMLDTVLPDTQRATDERRGREPGFKGRLEILSDCEVTEIRTRGGRANGLSCRLRLPGGKRQALEIDADTVIVAAGAVHSSRLLLESGIGGDRVGRELCANIGSHMTGWWSEGPPVRAYEGLQMSHVLEDGTAGPDYMVEAWFNPVMSQALVMPGWVGDHERNMRRYEQLGVLGVISGSTPNGNRVLRRREFLSGAEIDFTPSEPDLRRLLSGLRHAGGVLLEHGAHCVIPATFAYHEFRSAKELEELDLGRLVKDASDISVNTAHPQGGNALSSDPGKGVVDEHFRVHGFDNLYVCDASVFPTSVHVNPQLTVMALAHHATSGIA
jgi:choline dehydrogenase-like flavoprotein